MLTQNQIKHIRSLRAKKFREEFSQFAVEGNKLVNDLIDSSFRITGIFASADWIVNNLSHARKKGIPVYETLPHEMDRITNLSTPGPVLAVVEIPSPTPYSFPTGEGLKKESLYLALDDIRDPGNLGTIVRVADWFGIGTIVCSPACVDLFNPKVVQATMGSIARVQVYYSDLESFLAGLTGDVPVYGAYLEGENLYEKTLTGGGIILIGNESKGISTVLERFVTQKLHIPSSGLSGSGKAESLNASIATAIICSEFRRQERSKRIDN